MGTIGLPPAKEVFYAKKGGAAWMNNKKISVSNNYDHRKRKMFLFCGGHSDEGQKKFTEMMRRLNPAKIRFRSFASAGIEVSAVSCGRADGCVLVETKPWDVLPGVLLIRSAGGKVTNLAGKDWTINDTSLVGSNGVCHDELLDLIT